MSSERERPVRDVPALDVTDPKAMRALAHPVRMALLDLFNITPTLTATQASEVLGESPANCAFHLRTLAKYGFIEEVGGGKGRERPWRRSHSSLTIPRHKDQDPQTRIAAGALGTAMLDRWLDRIQRTIATASWAEEWEQSVTASNSVRYLTPDEATEATAEMLRVLDKYRGRTADPALRPAGARPVDINLFCYPLGDEDGAALSKSRDIS